MIYLDNNSTTIPELSALSYAQEVVSSNYGNPSSPHSFGRNASSFIDESRSYLAELLEVKPESLIFTSGGTESNNLAIFSQLNNHDLIAPVTEHSSIIELVKPENKIKVKSNGFIDWNHLEDRLKNTKRAIVAISYANNETGVILFDSDKLSFLKEKYNFHLHVDAVQAVGKIKLKVPEIIDSLSLSGHKFHSVKGIGALYLKPELNNSKLWAGGSQEFGIRPGTENIFGIVNLGIVAKIAKVEGPPNFKDNYSSFLESLSDVADLNGDPERKIFNTLNLYFRDLKDNVLFAEILSEEGVICSVGAACSSGILTESRVLRAMFPDGNRVGGSIRFSISKKTTQAELISASNIVKEVLERIKNDR